MAPKHLPTSTVQLLKLIIAVLAGIAIGTLLSDFANNRPLGLLGGSQVNAGLHSAAAGVTPAAGDACTVRALAPPRSRNELGALLEAEGMRTGAELGVQKGNFARQTLQQWHSCETYILVDVWRQQANYKDGANVDGNKQEEHYQTAMAAVEPFKAKVKVMRMFTSEAAPMVPDASLDYVYVDARHDYCGALEDIEMWWPKIKPGGLMAGHDYLTYGELVKDLGPGVSDWGLCLDGTRNEGAVKGAVAEFAQRFGLTVAVTYGEADGHFKTWMMRKPKC